MDDYSSLIRVLSPQLRSIVGILFELQKTEDGILKIFDEAIKATEDVWKLKQRSYQEQKE